MSSEAQALPLVPKQELAPGLQVSRVRPRPAASGRLAQALFNYVYFASWRIASSSRYIAFRNTLLLALQVVKGCWQLSGGHKCVPVLQLFSLLLCFQTG